MGLSFTEAGPPELFWLPGVPVSGVISNHKIPQNLIDSAGLVSDSCRILGSPESRSSELHDRHFVGLSFTEARPPEFGSGFPESRSPELVYLELVLHRPVLCSYFTLQ